VRLPALLLLLHGRALGVVTGLSQYHSTVDGWVDGRMDGWIGCDGMGCDGMGG